MGERVAQNMPAFPHFFLFYQPVKEIPMSIKTVLLSAAISLAAVAIAARVPQIKSVVFGA